MHDDIRFRGKAIDELTREEAIEALKQALSRVKEIEINPLGKINQREDGIRTLQRSAALAEMAEFYRKPPIGPAELWREPRRGIIGDIFGLPLPFPRPDWLRIFLFILAGTLALSTVLHALHLFGVVR